MRTVKIVVPKMRYTTGEVIAGFLEIECDEPFNSKRIEVEFSGNLYARGYKSIVRAVGSAPPLSGVDNSGWELKGNFIRGKNTISEDQHFDEGKTRIEFSIQIPDTAIYFEGSSMKQRGLLYPTYEGENASIKYLLLAKVTLSRINSLTATIPIIVSIAVEGLIEGASLLAIDEFTQQSIVDRNSSIMDISIDSVLYCIGSPLVFKYRLNTSQNIKRIIFEFSESEMIKIEDSHGMHTENLRTYIREPGQLKVDEWEVIVMNPKRNLFQHYASNVLRIFAALAITVERSGRMKKPLTTHIPLLAFECPNELKPVVPESESSKEAQKECPNCGGKISIEGLVRPDGRVICPKCFKKFIPN